MFNRSKISFFVFLVALAAAGGFIAPAHAEEDKSITSLISHPEFEQVLLNPMVLPIITDKGLTQQISLVISIETPYGKKADVEYLAPRLTDAYLQELYGRLGDGQDMQGGVIDIQAVKERLAVVTDKVLGKELVHDILLQVVHQAKR